MTCPAERWLVLGLLLAAATDAFAEDLTVTTYYPSPRGVYDELRTSGDVKIGDSSAAAPQGRLEVRGRTTSSTIDKALYVGNMGGLPRLVVEDGGNVGIGTASPGERLVVNGGVQIGDSSGTNPGTLRWNGTDVQVYTGTAWVNLGVPADTIAFFADSCPPGWSPYTEAAGRYIVGVPAGGTVGGIQGTPLTNLEDRPVGEHSHHGMWTTYFAGDSGRVTLAATGTNFYINSSAGGGDFWITAPVENVPTGTPAPYIQLLACQKN